MPRVQLETLRDFRGGLNLRADAMRLQYNESPDLINVDVDPAGGVHQRKGVIPFGGQFPAGQTIETLWDYSTTTGVRQMMASTGQNVYYSSGGDWSTAFYFPGKCRAATFKDRCYIQNGTSAPVRWNGTVYTLLFTNWNENIESPTPSGATGSMPIAAHVATYRGMAWVAGTVENGKEYPNRIRHSHPNFAEDWRSEDFIDIDTGIDGDRITALVPFGDRLLIFKNNSLYALYGYSPESFQVIEVDTERGTPSGETVVNTDLGVFFFSWPNGVYLYDGSKVKYQFERIVPALRDGRIPHAYQSQIQLGWGNRRLWVAVPWMGSTKRSRVFVLDPSLGKTGSWVMYDLAVGPFLDWNPPGDDSKFLAVDVVNGQCLRLDEDVPYDHFGDAGVFPIISKFRTPWIDLNEPAIPKRWKRPEILLQAGTGAQVFVATMKDYDPTKQSRFFTLNSRDPDEITPGWGQPWGTMIWRRGDTATSDTRRNELERGSPLGNSRSVALEFNGSDIGRTWGLNSVTFKYIPRRVRS